MEIIIGREEGVRRLHCIADGREFNVGQAGCVPASVSRKHCKITVNGNSMSIENLKPENITFVDGIQVFSKGITSTSLVQLGSEKYTIPLQQILQLATGQHPKPEPPTFSLRPMKAVWEEWEKKTLEIQVNAAKKANQQRIQGIISMCGMALGLLPIPIVFRAICVLVALVLGIYFFIQGQNSTPIQIQLNKLDKEYADKYKCPNPECGKPLGKVPYRLIEFNKQCFACGCKYTH